MIRLDRPAPPLHELGPALGFRRKKAPLRGDSSARTPREEWVRDGLLLRREGDWLTLVDRRAAFARQATSEPATDSGPGLWRRVRPARGRAERVFDLPPLCAEPDDTGDTSAPVAGEGDALRALLAWAVATRAAAPSTHPAGNGAAAPAALEAESVEAAGLALRGDDDVLPDLTGPALERLVARAGEHVVRGRLVREPGRVALVFPHVVELPAALADARRAWIAEIAQAAQDHWRLVRLGLAESPSGSGLVEAHVDLTGAPPALAPALAELAAAGLRAAVAWALPGLHAAADAGIESRVLSRAPAWRRGRAQAGRAASPSSVPRPPRPVAAPAGEHRANTSEDRASTSEHRAHTEHPAKTGGVSAQ